jgi:cytochrome c556
VFQAQVDALSRAGQRNDVEAMLMITKSLLESCVSCHRTFRK